MKSPLLRFSKIQQGFTLIEVMISLLIFATGMLGVAYQMSQGLKNTINTEVHSSVMQIALQSIEPLNRSINVSNTTFKNALTNLTNNGSTPPFAGNTNQSRFTISLDRAVDINNKSLLAEPVANWQAPYTIVLKISYDTTENTTLSYYTTHVMVPNV